MAALTHEQVYEAAESLAAKGEKPTQDKVREMLGGGSYSIISPALRKWKEDKRRERQVSTQVAPMPDDLSKRFSVWQAEIWQAAATASDERLAADRAAIKAEREDMAEQAAEDAQAIRTLEAEKEAAEKRAEQAEKEAQKRLTESVEAGKEIARMQALIEILTVNSEKAEQRADAAEKRLDALIVQLKTAEKKSDKKSHGKGAEKERFLKKPQQSEDI